jgi:hypothetical protein
MNEKIKDIYTPKQLKIVGNVPITRCVVLWKARDSKLHNCMGTVTIDAT